MEVSADLIATLAVIGGLVILAAIFAAADPTIRRKVSIVRKDRHVVSEWVGKKNLVKSGEGWVYRVRGHDYAAVGPWLTFEYRLVRSFGVKKYVGAQRIYMEGNPTPLDLLDSAEQIALLKDVGRLMAGAAESEPFDRLLKPRRMDWVMVILVGALALVVGLVLGGRLGP